MRSFRKMLNKGGLEQPHVVTAEFLLEKDGHKKWAKFEIVLDAVDQKQAVERGNHLLSDFTFRNVDAKLK